MHNISLPAHPNPPLGENQKYKNPPSPNTKMLYQMGAILDFQKQTYRD